LRFFYFKVLLVLILLRFNELESSQNLTQFQRSENLMLLNNEKRLINDLTKDYQVKFGRPVNDVKEKVVVYFELMLIQLIDLVILNYYYYHLYIF
jgi:hypothetical protein